MLGARHVVGRWASRSALSDLANRTPSKALTAAVSDRKIRTGPAITARFISNQGCGSKY